MQRHDVIAFVTVAPVAVAGSTIHHDTGRRRCPNVAVLDKQLRSVGPNMLHEPVEPGRVSEQRALKRVLRAVKRVSKAREQTPPQSGRLYSAAEPLQSAPPAPFTPASCLGVSSTRGAGGP